SGVPRQASATPEPVLTTVGTAAVIASSWIAGGAAGAPALPPAPIDPPTAQAAPDTQRVSVQVRGSIEASLTRAAGDAGPALAAQVARLLRWRGDVIRDVHPGDRISVLYERGEAPELVALEFEGAAFSLQAF